MYRLPSSGGAGPERTPLAGAARRIARVAWAIAAVALLGCDDPAAQRGPLRVTLVSPNGAEGGALFELPLEGVVSVGAATGALLESQSGGRRWVALLMSQPGPISLDLVVEDPTRPPAVRLVQVSGPDNQARGLGGYRVRVETPR